MFLLVQIAVFSHVLVILFNSQLWNNGSQRVVSTTVACFDHNTNVAIYRKSISQSMVGFSNSKSEKSYAYD